MKRFKWKTRNREKGGLEKRGNNRGGKGEERKGQSRVIKKRGGEKKKRKDFEGKQVSGKRRCRNSADGENYIAMFWVEKRDQRGSNVICTARKKKSWGEQQRDSLRKGTGEKETSLLSQMRRRENVIGGKSSERKRGKVRGFREKRRVDTSRRESAQLSFKTCTWQEKGGDKGEAPGNSGKEEKKELEASFLRGNARAYRKEIVDTYGLPAARGEASERRKLKKGPSLIRGGERGGLVESS